MKTSRDAALDFLDGKAEAPTVNIKRTRPIDRPILTETVKRGNKRKKSEKCSPILSMNESASSFSKHPLSAQLSHCDFVSRLRNVFAKYEDIETVDRAFFPALDTLGEKQLPSTCVVVDDVVELQTKSFEIGPVAKAFDTAPSDLDDRKRVLHLLGNPNHQGLRRKVLNGKLTPVELFALPESAFVTRDEENEREARLQSKLRDQDFATRAMQPTTNLCECPECKGHRAIILHSREVASEKWATAGDSARRLLQCQKCGHQFSD